METVILIKEENHGIIGVAKNYKSAIKYLIETHWLTDGTDIYDENTNEWKTIKQFFGKQWQRLFLDDWDVDIFSSFFDGSFYLSEEELIQ